MDRFRIDDPDAAEKVAALFVRAVYQNQALSSWPEHSRTPMLKGARAVLDAIEQPRLPTRSEVEAEMCDLGSYVPHIFKRMKERGWATEDPEPEVDPAHVEALAKLVRNASHAVDSSSCAWERLDGVVQTSWRNQARAILASSRVQVTPQ